MRVLAINMYKKEVGQRQISIILGVRAATIFDRVKLYEQYGKKGLKEVKRGREKGSDKLLSDKKEVEVQKTIIDKMPDQLKLPYALWTRKAIKDLIKYAAA
ncbi:Mobile element protein [hydrothermal vent metagenome]|uniref:Mobile element protein n=1 Tax=hydrothermal vent metagenome TaxID=652676 RepID=A0A3B0T627_9ZZZZ